jgi:hypothetical protein
MTRIYDPTIHSCAIATFNQMESETRIRKERDLERIEESYRQLMDIAHIMFDLFIDFAKDRFYYYPAQSQGVIYFTAKDIREPSPGDLWPPGTIRITGRPGRFTIERRKTHGNDEHGWAYHSTNAPHVCTQWVVKSSTNGARARKVAMVERRLIRRHNFTSNLVTYRPESRGRISTEALAAIVAQFEAALKAATGHQGLGNRLHDQFRRVLAACGRAPPPRAATVVPGPVPPAPSPFHSNEGLSFLKALCEASDGNRSLSSWQVHQFVRVLNLHGLKEQLEKQMSQVPRGTMT